MTENGSGTSIVVLIFDGLTMLDAIGPSEVLNALPGARISYVAKTDAPIQADTGRMKVVPHCSIDQVESADILLVPGGPGVRKVLDDAEVIDWIAKIHETTRWTTSVCNGSLLLGKAGVLKGLPATCHWHPLPQLKDYGATPTSERVVRAGKIITAAGVSSGIDMALTLAALETSEDMAKAIQLGIEYDPQPPFDCGSVEKAPEALANMVRMQFAAWDA